MLRCLTLILQRALPLPTKVCKVRPINGLGLDFVGPFRPEMLVKIERPGTDAGLLFFWIYFTNGVKGLGYLSFGVTRKTPPVLESSSIQRAPSGASSISRMRWPTSQRSAGLAPPLPSKTMRLTDMVARPLTRAEPFHWGNIAPL